MKENKKRRVNKALKKIAEIILTMEESQNMCFCFCFLGSGDRSHRLLQLGKLGRSFSLNYFYLFFFVKSTFIKLALCSRSLAKCYRCNISYNTPRILMK